MLIEGAYAVDAFFGVLLALKLETHRNFFKLGSLEGKHIMALWSGVEVPDNVLILKHFLIVLAFLGYSIVKSNDFSSRLARGNFDQVIHEESALQDCELGHKLAVELTFLYVILVSQCSPDIVSFLNYCDCVWSD